VLIPLGTDRQQVRTPIVTWWLIGLCVVAFLVQSILASRSPESHTRLLAALAVVGGDRFEPWQLITSAFLHGGLLHLLGNMLFLWVFGPNVEDRFGRLGFLGFYAGGASASAMLHISFENAPAIGASGAISAVAGAYLVLFPKTTVRIVYWFFIIGAAAIPAWWFIGFNIAWNLLNQAIGIDRGVAVLAHLGGYGYGIALSMMLLGLGVFPREPYDLWTIWRQARRRSAIRAAGLEAQRIQTQRIRGTLREQDDSQRSPAPSPVAEARARVLDAIDQKQYAQAGEVYRELVSRHGDAAGTLSPSHQVDLGNALFREGDYQTSALVYERFLDAYPREREAPDVRVMLGLINARYLNDPLRAGELLRRAVEDDGLDAQHAGLARQLLQELG